MIIVHTPDADERRFYLQQFRQALPGKSFVSSDDAYSNDKIDTAIVWRPQPDFFAQFNNLKAIFALGAGVDALVARQDIADDVELYRLCDAGMGAQMVEYVRYGVLHWQRQMYRYQHLQFHQRWLPQPVRRAADVRVCVLGLGELGEQVVKALVADGYRVSGWSRTMTVIDGVHAASGLPALDELLTQADVVVSLLPLTTQTKHLLDSRRLSLLPEGTAVINASRGAIIDENALLNALNEERLAFALLDVFEHEPLVASHPFWSHPRVMITPHVAAVTVAEEAVKQIAENIEKRARGEPIDGVVDGKSGY